MCQPILLKICIFKPLFGLLYKELKDCCVLRFRMTYLSDAFVYGIAENVLAHPYLSMHAHMEERCLHGREMWRSGV